MKQFVSALFILIILALMGYGVLLLKSKEPANTASTPANVEKSPILGGTLQSDGTYKFSESTDFYDIEAAYPRVVPLASQTAGEKAAVTLEQKLADSIASFKADLMQMLDPQEKARLAQSGAIYSYTMQYTVYADPHYYSYVYQIYEDTGGAHPNSFYLTEVFDQSGNEVTLQSLFEPTSNYLKILSDAAYPLVVSALKAKIGSDPDAHMLEMVRVGTEPSPEALQFFYLSNNELHLIFPPYQVAAYAAGSFDIAIPLTQLASSLAPDVFTE